MRNLKAVKLFVASVVLVSFCFLTNSASASLIVTEDFSYPDGSIAGRNGGESGLGSWSTPWAEAGSVPVTNHLEIQSEQLFSKPAGGSANVTRSFSSTVDPATTLYFAVDLTQAVNNEGGYDTRLHLLGGTVKVGVLNDLIRADLGSAFNTFDPGGGSDPAWTGTFRLVSRVEFNSVGSDEVMTFWINPASELDVPQFSLQADIGVTDLGSLVMFAKSGQEGNQIFFDNFAIGTDFEFSEVPPVPEPSSLALLGGVFALAASRRRRRLQK